MYIVGEQNCVKLSDTARTYSETCWNRSTRSARVLFVRSSKSVFVFFSDKNDPGQAKLRRHKKTTAVQS